MHISETGCPNSTELSVGLRVVCVVVTQSSSGGVVICTFGFVNKKHLKNVGPIRHNEPPHAHSADVATGTVARRLRIDVNDDIDNDDDNDNA